MAQLARRKLAITREVSHNIGSCELTYLQRQPINLHRAEKQHRAYEDCLTEAGFILHRLPADPALPDCVFVEDAAVVLDEMAVIARPGVDSRRPEVDAIAAALKPYRELAFIQPPGTLEGGDVLRIGKKIYVGHSLRSNREGISSFAAFVEPHGYTVIAIPIHGCLHLKSAVSHVAENILMINTNWVDVRFFHGMDFIEVDPLEGHAANALWLGDAVVYPTQYPVTGKRLKERGIKLKTIDMSEIIKAEGAVTCCSLLLSV